MADVRRVARDSANISLSMTRKITPSFFTHLSLSIARIALGMTYSAISPLRFGCSIHMLAPPQMKEPMNTTPYGPSTKSWDIRPGEKRKGRRRGMKVWKVHTVR